MILRRVIEHMKKQEWTAVFLDFLIVVVGVFIGLQVQEWSVARAEKESISAQLSSFREELIQRQSDINDQKAYIEDRINDATALRSGLMSEDQVLSENDVSRLAMSVVRTNDLDITFRGFEELSASGSLSKIKSRTLLEKLYRWDASLTNLRSTEEDVSTLRDISSMPAILDALSLGNMARTDSRFLDMPPANRFTVDIEALRGNRDFDNALVSRTILERQKLDALFRFQNATDELIDALEGGR